MDKMSQSDTFELTLPLCGACGSAYPEDALFCDHCGKPAVPALAPALLAVAAPQAGESETLAKVRGLVRDKTRFEPEDVQPVAEEDAAYPYRMVVQHALDARCVHREITGHFKASPLDVRCTGPGLPAYEERKRSPAFLRAAMEQLERQLREPETAYDALEDGLYLGARSRHYFLSSCSACDGDGKNQCHTCLGRGKEKCWECYGNLQVNCKNWSCTFGKVNCGGCGGAGTIARTESYQESVQVATTVYYNGESRTDYHTEYQTRYRQVYDSCYSCYGGGKVDCSQCGGSSRIQCPTCHAVGTVRCRTCGGGGELTCQPCAGSGKTGDAAWTEVHLEVAHAIDLPEGMPEDARRIVQREGPHALASQAVQVALHALERDDGAGQLAAHYAMPVRLVRLAAECSQVRYDLVAYGRELRWLTLDDIVEDLLQRDLQSLTGALARMADDGLFASDVHKLLDPLHNVAASELNADVVEAVLDGKAATAHAGVVSAEYASAIETAVLGALRHVYTRFAKQSWWHGAAAAAVLTLAGWAWAGLLPGLLLGALALPASLWLFRWRLRKVLGAALGGEAQAARAIELARKGRRDRTAYFLVLAPVMAVLAGTAWLLPMRGPWTSAAAPAAGAGAGTAVPAGDRAAAAGALRKYATGELVQARQELETLARGGNGAAYGPYGWMVLLGEGLQDWQAHGDDMRGRVEAALPWAAKAMAAGDSWGYATQGMIEVNRGGGHFDMQQGLRHLAMGAERGHLGAMHFLGTIYYKGVNVPVDLAQARKWFAMAAERDEPSALYNLGLMDWTGAGIARPDRAGAMKHWRRAAALGNENARKAVAKGRPAG